MKIELQEIKRFTNNWNTAISVFVAATKVLNKRVWPFQRNKMQYREGGEDRSRKHQTFKMQVWGGFIYLRVEAYVIIHSLQ